MAATERSTSSVVVVAFDTAIRMYRCPRQVVAPIQHVPSICTASTTRSVRSSPPNRASTWLRTTSLPISTPPAASCSANRRACAQHRSTRSTTPSRPSARSRPRRVARARLDDSSVRSPSLGTSPPEPVRYAAEYDTADRCTSGLDTNTYPESYGTFSHLCPSHDHESAAASPSTIGARRRAGRGPQAECSVHVHPRAVTMGQLIDGPIGSHAPVFTLPAWRQTIVGGPGSSASDAARGRRRRSLRWRRRRRGGWSRPEPQAVAAPGRWWRGVRPRRPPAASERRSDRLDSTSHPALAARDVGPQRCRRCCPPGLR